MLIIIQKERTYLRKRKKLAKIFQSQMYSAITTRYNTNLASTITRGVQSASCEVTERSKVKVLLVTATYRKY